MITSCPFCTTDTAGNHEGNCPYYPSLKNFTPATQDTTVPEGYTLPGCDDPNEFIKTSILITPEIYKKLIEFLEETAGGGCYCHREAENTCPVCTANDLLEQLKGT